MSALKDRFGEAGFTLLELLVVIAVLGLVASLVLSRGPVHSARQQVAAVSAILSGELRLARSRAIVSDRPVAFVLDPVRQVYRVGGGPLQSLPGGTTLLAPADGIAFAPDGSARGGAITVASGAIRSVIGVDWLTGRIGVAYAP